MKNSILSFLILFFSAVLIGQDDPSEFGMATGGNSALGGLSVGDQAPDIRADIGNTPFVLSEALEDGKVLLVFYRGYWCGVCNRHLSAFEKELGLLTERGIRVVAVSPEKMDYVNRTIEQTGMSVDVISDSDGKIMKDYKVFYEVTDAYNSRLNKYIGGDLAEVNGQDQAALPVPATYLIGQNQKVEFVHYDINYRNRASVQDILKALDQE